LENNPLFHQRGSRAGRMGRREPVAGNSREQKSAREIDFGGLRRRQPMSKILIGAAAAALWFALSHVASAQQVRDSGICISKCVEHPGTGLDIRAPGIGTGIG
jgi:hypothetical protein